MHSNAVKLVGAFAIFVMMPFGFAVTADVAHAQGTTPPQTHTYAPKQSQTQTLAYCEDYARDYADSKTGDPGRSTVRGAGRGALIGGILDGDDGAGRGAAIGAVRGLLGSREGGRKWDRYYNQASDRCVAAR